MTLSLPAAEELHRVGTWAALGCALWFFLLFLAGLARREGLRRFLAGAGLVLQGALFLLLGGAVAVRGIEVGHQPWQSWYEVLIFCAALSVLCVLLLRFPLRRYRRGRVQRALFDLFQGAAAFVTFWLLLTAAGKDPRGSALPPALKSFWFAPHVVAYILAYALLLLVAGAVVLWWGVAAWERWLLRGGKEEVKRWLADFDGFAYTMAAIAFPFLTLALILGALWGQDAWGNWWGWDCKETCALITWLIYILYFHLRLSGGWRGWRSNLLLFLGGVAILVTLLLVNYLPASMSSLHKYV